VRRIVLVVHTDGSVGCRHHGAVLAAGAGRTHAYAAPIYPRVDVNRPPGGSSWQTSRRRSRHNHSPYTVGAYEYQLLGGSGTGVVNVTLFNGELAIDRKPWTRGKSRETLMPLIRWLGVVGATGLEPVTSCV
jgi:hypothetical protein